MKRYFYIFLMMLFFVMLICSLYFCIIYGLVINHVIPLRNIIYFTDTTLSPVIFIILTIVGIGIGYIFGVKWWKIIYIDKVYYFGEEKNPKKSHIPQKRKIK